MIRAANRRVYTCPDCNGAGGHDFNRTHGRYGPDPQCDEWEKCHECSGTGVIVMDRHEAHELGLVRHDAPMRDALEHVAFLRRHHRSGPYYQQAYGQFLQRVVSPLDRPLP